MDLRLVFSTFFVIFLAELGDKTQFAAMAASAGCNKPVSVLIGSILALSLSSVIAVAAGGLIGKYIPERYIKIAAGVLFLVFGLLYIREAFTLDKTPPKHQAALEQSLLGESVIKAARAFEEQELKMFEEVRERIGRAECKKILNNIIEQEKGHLRVLSEVEIGSDLVLTEDSQEHSGLSETYCCGDDDLEILQDVCNREAAMADFYLAMSQKSKIASIRNIFYSLYLEELKHFESIKSLCDEYCV